MKKKTENAYCIHIIMSSLGYHQWEAQYFLSYSLLQSEQNEKRFDCKMSQQTNYEKCSLEKLVLEKTLKKFVLAFYIKTYIQVWF